MKNINLYSLKCQFFYDEKKNIYKIDDLVQINGFLKSNTYRIANNITKNF